MRASSKRRSASIDLPGPATGPTGDNDGTAYLSTRGGYFVVDLRPAGPSG